jgi:hypothetical protein
MKKNNQIEKDKEFQKLKSLLQELPKIEAPDNFEYNLMTRIQNKSFEIKSENKKNIFFWVYTPAFALVASVVLVFFIFTDSDLDSEDPWNIQPKLRPELQSSNSLEDDKLQVKEQESNLGSTIDTRESLVKVKSSKQIQKPTAEGKEIAANQQSQPVYPFNKSESVDLHQLLKDEESKTLNNGIPQPKLANKHNPKSQFDGFFLRQVEAAARKESLRIQEDSLKQLKDSINNTK